MLATQTDNLVQNHLEEESPGYVLFPSFTQPERGKAMLQVVTDSLPQKPAQLGDRKWIIHGTTW